LLQQVNNQLVHDFLSQQNNRLFLFWAYGFTEGLDLHGYLSRLFGWSACDPYQSPINS
jgi:hypothetical protein